MCEGKSYIDLLEKGCFNLLEEPHNVRLNSIFLNEKWNLLDKLTILHPDCTTYINSISLCEGHDKVL